MKKAIFWLSGMWALALALLACAPAAAPSPPSPAPAPQAAPAAPALSPEEAAWAKVVEAAKKETKVVVYDYFLVGDVGLRTSKAFETRYGIKVEVITGRGAEFLERLKTEKRIGRIVADALSSSASHVINLKEARLTVSTASQLPELRESKPWAIDPRHFDPEGHVLGINNTNYNAYVNTTLVRPDEWPKSLQDLLNPRWKGKILALDPTVSTGIYNYFVPLFNRGLLDQDYLKALGEQKLLFKVSGLDAAAALARGEASLLLPLSESQTGPSALAGAPIRAVALDYTLGYMSGLAGVKGAPHPNALLVWLNWRLSQEGQLLFAEGIGVPSLRKDVPDFRPVALRAEPNKLIVVSGKDMEDAGRHFREKTFVPWLKR